MLNWSNIDIRFGTHVCHIHGFAKKNINDFKSNRMYFVQHYELYVNDKSYFTKVSLASKISPYPGFIVNVSP